MSKTIVIRFRIDFDPNGQDIAPIDIFDNVLDTGTIQDALAEHAEDEGVELAIRSATVDFEPGDDE